MLPTDFPEANTLIAEHQPQYLTLPAFVDDDGVVISCWAATWKERLRVLFTGKLWLSVMTFKDPLQPLRVQAERPFLDE